MPTTRRSTAPASALALALALGLPPASAAQAVAEQAPLATFKAPEHSPVRETIVLDARGSKSDAPLEWFVDGPKGIEKTAPDAKNEMGLIVDPPAGTYRVFLIAVAPSGKKHMAFRAIEVGAISPPRPPVATKPPLLEPNADLKIPSHLVAGSHIVLDATKSKSAGPIVWKVEGPRQLVAPFSPDRFSPDPKDGPAGSLAVIFNAPAGEYAVTATAVGEGEAPPKTIGPVVFNVVDSGPLAAELPTAPAAGYAGQISAVLVVDLGDVPAGHAPVIIKDNVHPYLAPGNFTYDIKDVRSSDFAGTAYDQYIKGGFIDPNTGKVAPKVATPALILNRQDGRFLACDPAPSSPKGIAAKIREVRIKVGAGG